MLLRPQEWFEGCAQNPAETIGHSTGKCFPVELQVGNGHGEMEMGMGQTQLAQLRALLPQAGRTFSTH